MGNFLEHLRTRVLVADGAMGTELMMKGLPAGACPEEWNVSHPEAILAIHEAYVQAGADILLTNTFGSNRLKLEAYGMGGRVEEICRRGAALARKAGGMGRIVLGDIGPTGQLMAPFGLLPFEDFEKTFAETARALAEGGVDGIIIETMMDVEEARAAVRAAKETNLPVVLCMIFNRDNVGGGYHTAMGVDPAAMAHTMEEEGADVVGANCGMGIVEMIPLIREIRAHVDLPIMAEPNAGLPRLEGGRTVYRESAEEMASHAGEMLAAGANILGGCCGTTAEHIRKIAETMKRAKT